MRFALISLVALAASAVAVPTVNVAERSDVDAQNLEARIDDLTAAIEAFDNFGGNDGLEARDDSDEGDDGDEDDGEDHAETKAAVANFNSMFKDLDDIPDEIVNDPIKSAEYFYSRVNGNSKRSEAVDPFDLRSLEARRSFWGCVKALTSAVPISKIWKLAKLIRKAGGVQATARKLIRCRSRNVCQRLYGDAILGVFDFITGIPSIKRECIDG